MGHSSDTPTESKESKVDRSSILIARNLSNASVHISLLSYHVVDKEIASEREARSERAEIN